MIAKSIKFSWQRLVFDEDDFFIHPSKGGGIKAKRVF